MSEGLTVLFQGDSITDCGRNREIIEPNLAMGEGYAMLTASKLLAAYPEKEIKCYNRGISGNRVVDLYARWKIDALNLKPDVISILIGVNDTWHEFGSNNGVEVPRYARVYHELLSWTKEALPDVKLILCEPFVLTFGAVGEDWVPEINERREVVRKLAKEFDTVFIPFQSIFDKAVKKAAPEYWLRDGVHPAYAGHELMSQAWLDATKDLF
jgi:lysophospholipase L1-like esterase